MNFLKKKTKAKVQNKYEKPKSKSTYLKFKDLKLHTKKDYPVPENINPECPTRHLL